MPWRYRAWLWARGERLNGMDFNRAAGYSVNHETYIHKREEGKSDADGPDLTVCEVEIALISATGTSPLLQTWEECVLTALEFYERGSDYIVALRTFPGAEEVCLELSAWDDEVLARRDLVVPEELRSAADNAGVPVRVTYHPTYSYQCFVKEE